MLCIQCPRELVMEGEAGPFGEHAIDCCIVSRSSINAVCNPPSKGISSTSVTSFDDEAMSLAELVKDSATGSPSTPFASSPSASTSILSAGSLTTYRAIVELQARDAVLA